jgi:class 3 adenylate cyclase
VLWAPYVQGEDAATPEAARSMVALIRANWSLGKRAMTGIAFPSGPIKSQRWWSDVIHQSVSPEVAARYFESITAIDIRSYLPRVKAPTLVLAQNRDRFVPIEGGRAAAALIPDVRFVSVDGDVGHPLFAATPHVETMRRFLDEGHPQLSTTGAAPAAGLVTILFTDMEGSTSLTQQLGDAKAQDVIRTHNTIIRDALRANSGSETKHTGDGIMASFPSASSALEAAISIQRAFAHHNEAVAPRPEPVEGRAQSIRVRIGLNAGEPVAEDADLFGTAVQLAARICAHAEPGQILVPEGVRHLVAGKKFLFADLGDTVLRGFEDPVRLYELRWQGQD